MKCPECHRKVFKRDRFCPHCGAPLHQRPPIARPVAAKSSPNTNWPLITAAVLVGVIIGAVAMYSRSGNTGRGVQAFDPHLRGPQLAATYPQVYEVAAQFNCPCGSCNDGLEVCDCEMKNGASEVRAFIYAQLQSGHKPFHVAEMVEQRWGHRKGAPIPDANRLKEKLQTTPKLPLPQN